VDDRIVVLLLLTGCASAPRPAAPAPASVGAPLDLSGEWISGFAAEPKEAVVRLSRPCGQTVTIWRVTHLPGALMAILVSSAPLTGVAHNLPIAESVAGQGDSAGFALRGTEVATKSVVAYRLRYDAATRRLRGKRNDQPVWFAPVEVQEPRNCRDPLMVPPPFSVTGNWATGYGAADAAPPVVTISPPCNYSPAVWAIQQNGDTVYTWHFGDRYARGVRDTSPPERIAETGRVTGSEVTLDGDAHYRLRYDPESGHLRGTKDGRLFWAVKQEEVRKERCVDPK
jgi:hypothetical protein